jgi:CRP-like cAMP-binding protein
LWPGFDLAQNVRRESVQDCSEAAGVSGNFVVMNHCSQALTRPGLVRLANDYPGAYLMAYKLNFEGLLGKLHIFHDLEFRHLARIGAACRHISVPKREFAFRKGDEVTGLYVVLTGHIKLSLPAGPNEKAFDFCGPGRAFSEAEIFLDKPHWSDAQALEDTILLWIDKREVFRIMGEVPSFSRNILTNLSEHCQSLVEDIEAVTLQSALQRLIGFLLVQPRDGKNVRLPYSKGIVASKLGLSPETLSRLLSQLTTAGLISVQGRVVCIHEPDALRTQQQCAAV